jgi:group I intron endonuclease
MNSGIYKIINIKTNEFYIGSSHKLEKRKRTHFSDLRRNRHHSIHLQRSYNKYGRDNFKFEVIEYCEEVRLLDLENYYLKVLKPEYNMSKDARSPMKGRKHKKETIEKFKKIKRVSGKDHYAYGTKYSKERIQKLVESRKGYKHSEETKKKMSETSKRLNRWLDLKQSTEKQRKSVIDSSGNTFKSMIECARYWKISVQTVCDILKGRHYKTRKGISFKYA